LQHSSLSKYSENRVFAAQRLDFSGKIARYFSYFHRKFVT